MFEQENIAGKISTYQRDSLAFLRDNFHEKITQNFYKIIRKSSRKT